jgi:hypothetical protein
VATMPMAAARHPHRHLRLRRRLSRSRPSNFLNHLSLTTTELSATGHLDVTIASSGPSHTERGAGWTPKPLGRLVLVRQDSIAIVGPDALRTSPLALTDVLTPVRWTRSASRAPRCQEIGAAACPSDAPPPDVNPTEQSRSGGGPCRFTGTAQTSNLLVMMCLRAGRRDYARHSTACSISRRCGCHRELGCAHRKQQCPFGGIRWLRREWQRRNVDR